MSPTDTPIDGRRGWSGGCIPAPISVSPPQGVCPHTWVCVLVPVLQHRGGACSSCMPAAVGELTHCEAQVWGYIPVWDQTQSLAHSLSGPRDILDWDKSCQRRGQTPPGLWLGLRCRQEAAGSHPCCHLLPPASLSSASSVSPHPHRHLATSVSPSHQSWLGVGWEGAGGGKVMGSILPSRRQPSSQAGCLLLLLLSPPGHLRAGRRTIARRMSKMVPIALATHSRAAGSGGARQLPEKRVLPRRRGCWRR